MSPARRKDDRWDFVMEDEIEEQNPEKQGEPALDASDIGGTG